MLDRTATATLAVIDEAHTIDELGALRARMADLELAEKALKQKLVHLKPGAYEGNMFRLAVIESTREKLDLDAVREKLSHQFLTAHTTEYPVRTLKTSSRNGKGLAA
jgi:hypothetical protein